MSGAPKYTELPTDIEHRSSLHDRAFADGRSLRSRTVLILSLELIWLAVSAAVLVRWSHLQTGQSPDLLLSLGQAGMLVLVYAAAFYLMDLYDLDRVRTWPTLLLNLAQAIGLICITLSLLERCFDGWQLPLKLVLLHAGLTAVLVIIVRAAIDRLISSRWPRHRVGFVGSARACEQLQNENNEHRWLGFRLHRLGEHLCQARRQLRRGRRQAQLQRLIIDEACLEQAAAGEFLQECRQGRINVESLSSFRERAFGKLAPRPDLREELLTAAGRPLAIINSAARRVRDVLLAGIALAITFPLMLIIAVAIKCDSSGPVLFFQDRVGKNGRHFGMIKFRSMHQAGKIAPAIEWTTSKRDPRITRVGTLLRGFHLDELPQLINVLKGDMSLIGPRPFHPLHHAQLERVPCFPLRLLLLPGITGWAQVRCDYADSVDNCQEVLARDLYYVKHASLILDLMILAETVRICLWRRGAR